jgi:CubicO group peptidase (beta-lactamase class C family)
MWGNQSRLLPVLLKEVLERLPNASSSVLVHTGNVYALQGLRSNIPCILGMETGESYMVASLDALFGHRGIRGKLPVSIDSLWNPKIELNTRAWIRFRSLELSDPELLGFNCDEEASLNGIMDSVILSGASQTAQLLVLKNGQIVYDISRGKMPDGKKRVNMHSIYDIASITKTAATTLAVMHVFEKEDINLEKPIQAYWPEARKFAWGSVKIQDFLLHRSGLPAFLPLYSTLKSDSFFIQRDSLHQPKSGDILWGNSLYLNRSVSDTVWAMIGQTAPKIYHESQDLQPYIYSDLNAIILGKWIEYRSGTKLAVFCDSIFYTPMGMFRTGFEPRTKHLTPWILPTQIDTATKRGLIWAETHDPTAYLLGGSAGNAGLFSSAYDLARLMLMLAQGGTLDGTRYFKTETIERFTSGFLYADNHRGLGFDKPNGYPNALKNSEIKGSNLFEGAPNSLFGHAGFTGTWAYADAKNQLVWIFLSNRTYPNDSQNKLAKKGYRGKLMEIVYRSLKADDKP